MKVLTDNWLFVSMTFSTVVTLVFSLVAVVRIKLEFEQPLTRHDARRAAWTGLWMFRLCTLFGVIAALAAIWTVFIKNATDGNAPVVAAILSCLMAMLLVAGAYQARSAFDWVLDSWEMSHAIHGASSFQQ